MNINVKQNDLSNTNNNELVVEEVLLESLKKQAKDWKPHHRNSTTWAFFKVNNNYHVDLNNFQIMQCIVCHNDMMVCLKILALGTSCCKYLIAYHKINGIITIKNMQNNTTSLYIKGIERR